MNNAIAQRTAINKRILKDLESSMKAIKNMKISQQDTSTQTQTESADKTTQVNITVREVSRVAKSSIGLDGQNGLDPYASVDQIALAGRNDNANSLSTPHLKGAKLNTIDMAASRN